MLKTMALSEKKDLLETFLQKTRDGCENNATQTPFIQVNRERG